MSGQYFCDNTKVLRLYWDNTLKKLFKKVSIILQISPQKTLDLKLKR